jgi:choline kinase
LSPNSCAPIAIILAAGIGRRLGSADQTPKVLLEFGGLSLLARHLTALAMHGIEDVAITIGHRGDTIRQAVAALAPVQRITFVENPDYRTGSVVSLAVQAPQLRSGRPILLMDGDVLYDERMIGRLLTGTAENIMLVDPVLEPGDEPVKICFREGTIVDFRKRPEHPHDWHGESVGFFRFSPQMAAELAGKSEAFLAAGKAALEYEEAIRDLLLSEPSRFGAVDVGDLPWTEIDFEQDVARARNEILPQLQGPSA